jgi:4'-phosphopantetheinyl transferase
MIDENRPPAQPRWEGASPDRLAADDIQLWLFSLDRPPLRLDHLRELLSPDERARADRFRFEIHRRRFTAGRGLLREALGRWLGAEPRSLVFRYGAKGKPSLSTPSAPDLRFNLSHSQDLGLLAVAWGRELGVDVEACRPLEDAAGLVERFFAPGERAAFSALQAERRLAGFYSGWTRKEAYVKARGDGLSLPTTSFEMTVDPDGPAALLAFAAEPTEVERWTFTALDPAPDFLGALAVEASGGTLVERTWRE